MLSVETGSLSIVGQMLDSRELNADQLFNIFNLYLQPGSWLPAKPMYSSPFWYAVCGCSNEP